VFSAFKFWLIIRNTTRPPLRNYVPKARDANSTHHKLHEAEYPNEQWVLWIDLVLVVWAVGSPIALAVWAFVWGREGKLPKPEKIIKSVENGGFGN